MEVHNDVPVKQEREERFEGSYWQWLKEELTGWDTFPWALFGFGVGFEFATLLLGKIDLVSIVSFIGIFFGMWCTVAMAAGGTDKYGNRVSSRSINGVMGTMSVAAYIYVNLTAGHWFSVVDQLFFFFLIDLELLLTWRTWGRGKNAEMKTLVSFDKGSSFGHKVKQWLTSKWPLVIITILVLWFGLYHLGIILNDSNPFWDALTLAIGATASFLCFRRYAVTMKIWVFSDIINICLWFTALQEGYSQAALPMLVMTIFYTITALYGTTVWRPTKK